MRSTLKREARRADWGASSSSKISYRFFVEQLELREEAGVLHVTCTALGRLPKGKSAKSHIAFGGDPHDRKKVVERAGYRGARRVDAAGRSSSGRAARRSRTAG